MISQTITNMSVADFRQRSEGKKVVLLYPWTTYRNLFLTHFLQTKDEGFLYYRVTGENPSMHDWLTEMVAWLGDAVEGFGDNLSAALKEKTGPAQLGEAFAADLAAIKAKEPIALFIDEFDRAALNGPFKEFITAAVAALPDGIQLAFSSRRLTNEPWYEMVARDEALILGTEFRKDNVMFTIEDVVRPQLEIYALGSGYAFVNGREIKNWDGALPRNLFFYFVDHPLVTRDEIFATFWPNLSVKEATNVFHVTKRKISERISMQLEDDRSYELTQYNAGFYMPSDKVMRHYDVADFQDAIEKSMIATSDDAERELLVQATELYKGDFLKTVSMQWTNERREHLRQLQSQALISLARLHKRKNEWQYALGYFTRALFETPEREDIHREVMSIYLQQEMYLDAQQQYLKLEQILDETLGIQPSRETRDLYDLVTSHI